MRNRRFGLLKYILYICNVAIIYVCIGIVKFSQLASYVNCSLSSLCIGQLPYETVTICMATLLLVFDTLPMYIALSLLYLLFTSKIEINIINK